MDIDLIKCCPLFINFKKGELADLLSDVNYNIRSYADNELVVQSGDPCEYLICVLEGCVRGEMLDESGKTIKIEDIPAPRMLASAFLFGSKSRYPVNVVACNQVKLMYIPRKELLNLFHVNERILVNFLNSISNRSQFLSNKIRFLSFTTIKEKMASYLLNLPKSRDEIVYLPITQNELAESFGVTRPALARVLKKMADEELISIKGKRIEILDRKTLNIISSYDI